MYYKSSIFIFLICLSMGNSAPGILERSYELVRNFGPKLYSIASCISEDSIWDCAKVRISTILDFWEQDVTEQRRAWQDAASKEVTSNGLNVGRTASDDPSRVGSIVELSLFEFLKTLEELFNGVTDVSEARKKGGGIDSITVMAAPVHKKKKRPPKIHLIAPHPHHMMMMKAKGTDGTDDRDDVGHESDVIARSLHDQGESRGKKKKKKKAILKLLLLGAVLKAKISLLLQILSAKLQVKFFLIALAGLAINLARFWLDVKKGSTPQKVIYYEHAQHQHHYEHEDEHGGGGYWSRSIGGGKNEDGHDGLPVATEEETLEVQNTPYRGWLSSRKL